MTLFRNRGSNVAVRVAAVLAAAGIALAGCSTDSDPVDAPDANSEAADNQAGTDDESLGESAQPADSPNPAKNLPGVVNSAADTSPILDLDYVSLDRNDPHVAELTEGTLRIGPPESLATDSTDSVVEVPVDDSCTTLTPSANGVAVACDGEVVEYDNQGELIASIEVPGNVSTATILQDGTLVAGFHDSDRLRFFTVNGDGVDKRVAEEESIIVTRSIDSLLHFVNDRDEEQLAVIDRGQTSITDVNIDEQELRGALRIGQGVGTSSAGRGNQGIVIASDAREDQFQLFTMNDVVRQDQAAPTGESPWSVLWDAKNELAWISTTTDNKLTGYKINEGTPIKAAEFDTIGDVRHIIDGPEGDILIVNSDGQTQYLDGQTIKKLVDTGVDDAEDFPVFVQD